MRDQTRLRSRRGTVDTSTASAAAPRPRPSLLGVGVLGLLGGLAMLVAWSAATSGDLSGATRWSTVSHGAVGAWSTYRDVILNPFYLGFIAALAILQWRFPARRDQRGPGIGWAADLVWFLCETALAATMIAGVVDGIGRAYGRIAGDWSLLGHVRPVWLVAVAAFVITDLLAWWTHWLHHKVPTLWRFHAVHHSQRVMNPLSDNREHVVETVVAASLSYLPARVLGLDASAARSLAFLTIYVSAFIHTNVRSNLGPLGYVLISPQAHRLHHSPDPDHHDANFGTVFSCWDSLFGTRHPDREVYPSTGLQDPAYPLETSANPLELVASWVRQTLYPFRSPAGSRAGDARASVELRKLG